MKTREVLRKILPKRFYYTIRDVVYPEKIGLLENKSNSLLFTSYKEIASPYLNQKVAFKNAEFKVYSKHGCDGMLLYIFSKIHPTNYTFVEMGVEDGRECNTANLSINFGWRGLLIDANKDWVARAREYYAEQLERMVDNVKIVDCFVDAENINPLLKENGFKGEIDLLSIDIDSNDYWVWKSIEVINPRVVVIEYNAAYGLRSMTMRYNPHFHKQKDFSSHPLYFGASLAALTKLGREKGYRLVACDTHGHDAYFVRDDVAEGIFSDLTPEEAFYPNPFTLGAFGSVDTQFSLIEKFDHEEI